LEEKILPQSSGYVLVVLLLIASMNTALRELQFPCTLKRYLGGKKKLKYILVQALRLCTGHTAQRGVEV
jgi:hypothetical protein